MSVNINDNINLIFSTQNDDDINNNDNNQNDYYFSNQSITSTTTSSINNSNSYSNSDSESDFIYEDIEIDEDPINYNDSHFNKLYSDSIDSENEDIDSSIHSNSMFSKGKIFNNRHYDNNSPHYFIPFLNSRRKHVPNTSKNRNWAIINILEEHTLNLRKFYHSNNIKEASKYFLQEIFPYLVNESLSKEDQYCQSANRLYLIEIVRLSNIPRSVLEKWILNKSIEEAVKPIQENDQKIYKKDSFNIYY